MLVRINMTVTDTSFVSDTRLKGNLGIKSESSLMALNQHLRDTFYNASSRKNGQIGLYTFGMKGLCDC